MTDAPPAPTESPQDRYERALSLLFGTRVERDERAAVALLESAALDGHVEAQSTLASLYSDGRGVERDERRAAEWYRAAAENGCPHSCFMLAFANGDGRGVPQDIDQKYAWFLRAAELGQTLAFAYVARAYQQGTRTIPRDFGKAAHWLRRAAYEGHDAEAIHRWAEICRARGDLVEAYALLFAGARAYRHHPTERVPLLKALDALILQMSPEQRDAARGRAKTIFDRSGSVGGTGGG